MNSLSCTIIDRETIEPAAKGSVETGSPKGFPETRKLQASVETRSRSDRMKLRSCNDRGQLAEKFTAAGVVLPEKAEACVARGMGYTHLAEVFSTLGRKLGAQTCKLAAGPDDCAGIGRIAREEKLSGCHIV